MTPLSDSFKKYSRVSHAKFRAALLTKFSIDEIRAFTESDAFETFSEDKKNICLKIINPFNEVEIPTQEAWKMCKDCVFAAKVLKVLPDSRYRLVKVKCVLLSGLINIVGRVKVKPYLYQPNSTIYVQPSEDFPVFIWRRDMECEDITESLICQK